MTPPLYIAIIRHQYGGVEIKTYTRLNAIQEDNAGTKRIVTSWSRRNSLFTAVKEGRDWPINLTSEERSSILFNMRQLDATSINN